jgi:hypothetical protein
MGFIGSRRSGDPKILFFIIVFLLLFDGGMGSIDP